MTGNTPGIARGTCFLKICGSKQTSRWVHSFQKKQGIEELRQSHQQQELGEHECAQEQAHTQPHVDTHAHGHTIQTHRHNKNTQTHRGFEPGAKKILIQNQKILEDCQFAKKKEFLTSNLPWPAQFLPKNLLPSCRPSGTWRNNETC